VDYSAPGLPEKWEKKKEHGPDIESGIRRAAAATPIGGARPS